MKGWLDVVATQDIVEVGSWVVWGAFVLLAIVLIHEIRSRRGLAFPMWSSHLFLLTSVVVGLLATGLGALSKFHLFWTVPVLFTVLALLGTFLWRHASSLARKATPAEEMPPRSLSPDLVRGLSDPEEKVRCKAAFAIGQIGDPRAVPFLLSALEGLNRAEHLSHDFMLQALGELRDPRALPCLVVWLNKGSHKAAVALGNIRDPAAAAALWKALSETRDVHFRACILSALDKLGEPIVDPMDSMIRIRECPESVLELAGRRGDASSVAPLLERIRTATGIFQAAAAAKAVADLLSRNLSTLDTSDLESIAALKDTQRIYPDSEYGSVGTLNCTHIRRIAQQELERRASVVGST